MERMRGLLSLRNLIVVAAIALVLSVLIVSTTSEAVLGVWVYYSNASYTTVVGARGTGCCGHVINWGVTTPFKRFERIYCLDLKPARYAAD